MTIMVFLYVRMGLKVSGDGRLAYQNRVLFVQNSLRFTDVKQCLILIPSAFSDPSGRELRQKHECARGEQAGAGQEGNSQDAW